MNRYPQSYRLPDASYAMSMDTGVVRTPFETGHHRQRRRYKTLPTVVSVTFDIANSQKHSWLMWWNNNAFDWFEMPLPTLFEDLDHGENCKISIVRAISELEIRPNGPNHVRINALIEISPANSAAVATALDCFWIIGGAPGAPAADTITAGAPGAPAADIITAGDPGHPACPI